jgi:uncharacterized protein with FMN-binding domain
MRRVILAIVSTAAGLVLLLSFKTHSTSAVAPPPAAVSGPGNPPGPSGGGTSAATGTGTGTGGSAGGSATVSKTVTGDAANTIYGPVQVQLTVSNGKITAVRAVEYPENSPRDAQINAYAIPALNREVLAADSARIDMVSGATYTSNGYLTSLQSALDKAGR